MKPPPFESASGARFIVASAATRALLAEAERVARFDVPVLIEGETGSGKELLARFLHDRSPRRTGPLVAVNCAAIPDPLLESELFGHARGAFTGAHRERAGLVEAASGGTLFLDEVADLSPRGQSLLLRAIQEREFRRVGETKTRRSDFRLLAAAQRPLAELAVACAFRTDLLYRLQVVRLRIPPLRERVGELPTLARALLARLAARHRLPAPELEPTAIERLSGHDWPGNVRELESALAAALVRRPGAARLGSEAFDGVVASPDGGSPDLRDDDPLSRLLALRRLAVARRAFERLLVLSALERAAGNRSRAARELGITRQGLARVLRRVGIG